MEIGSTKEMTLNELPVSTVLKKRQKTPPEKCSSIRGGENLPPKVGTDKSEAKILSLPETIPVLQETENIKSRK